MLIKLLSYENYILKALMFLTKPKENSVAIKFGDLLRFSKHN